MELLYREWMGKGPDATQLGDAGKDDVIGRKGEVEGGTSLRTMAGRMGAVKGTFHMRTKPDEGAEVYAWESREDMNREA